jgi:hypothetical protein
MLFWYPVLTLMIDTMQVIDIRLRLIAAGKSIFEEMSLMVKEKIDALAEPSTIIIRAAIPGRSLTTTGRLSRLILNG